jgi:hypothetical protein
VRNNAKLAAKKASLGAAFAVTLFPLAGVARVSTTLAIRHHPPTPAPLKSKDFQQQKVALDA